MNEHGPGAGPGPELIAALLRQGTSVRMRVTGQSMRPLLPDDSTVWVRPSAARDLAVGDLALVCAGPDRLLLHRVRQTLWDAVGGHSLVIQGDACAAPDGTFAGDAVLGQAYLQQVDWNLYSVTVPLDTALARFAGRSVAAVLDLCRRLGVARRLRRLAPWRSARPDAPLSR